MADLAAFWQKVDIITPLALRVAATLRVADHIAGGDAGLPELAARTGADPDALGRLLRYLTARGVFVEPSPDRFALNDWAEFLRDSDPSGTRAWLDLEGFGGRMDLAFVGLLATVRTGHPPHSGHEANMTPGERTSFDDLMETQNRAQAPAIATAWDFAKARYLVDVGGGSGALTAHLLRAHPSLRAALIDLPGTAEKATRLFAEEGVGDRAEVVAANILETMPSGGDVYILKFILHGFSNAQSIEILRRARQAAAPEGRILIIERTVEPEEDRGPFTAMDLRMLILGEGRERTLEEYGALAREVGLVVASARPTEVGVHVIELRPETIS